MATPNVSNYRGIDTFGQPIRSHVQVIEQQFEDYQSTIQSIRHYLSNNYRQRNERHWTKKRFGVLSIQPLCKFGKTLLIPAEFAICIFSLTEGVIETHSGFIEPGDLPFGEKAEAIITCKENGYPNPIAVEAVKGMKAMNRMSVKTFMGLVNTLAHMHGLLNAKKQILLFAARGDIPVVNSCLSWTNLQKEKLSYEIVSFEILLMEMSRAGVPEDDLRGLITHEGGAGKFIYNTQYDFHLNLGCNWHRQGDASDKLDKCASNIATRRAYNALQYLCHLTNTPLEPKKHFPVREGIDC